MNFEIGVVTHTIPHAIGITIPAVEMLTVEQSVLVVNGLLQTYPGITMGTIHILTISLSTTCSDKTDIGALQNPSEAHFRSVEE